MSVSIGVIGLGRMAQALVLPLLESGALRGNEVLAVVGQDATIARLKGELPSEIRVVSSSDPRAQDAWAAPIQLLAVKPQQFHQVAAGVSTPSDGDASLVISVLAGVNLEKLQSALPGRVCVRAVPNTPCLVAQGLCGLSWGSDVTPEQKSLVRRMFEPVSEVLELPESQLDAFLALTSSGPAYVALIAESMADGAVAAGLPRVLAHHLAHRTLAGTAALLQEQELHPGQLKDLVASPGGTTMAALRRLEQAGVRSALIEAVVAATEHGRSLR